MSSRIARILVVGAPNDPVGGTHKAVDVTLQWVVETLCHGELEVLGGSVERGADDGAVGVGEIVGAVTQRLPFECSTRCRGLGVPPQQHPPAVEVGQADVGAMLIGKAEAGSNSSGNEHPYRLRAFVVGGVDFVGPAVEPRSKTRSGRPACRFLHAL